MMGIYQGILNPLPSTLKYRLKINIIQMINLYQLGDKKEGIVPLKVLKVSMSTT
jgi:hypothetical protein